MKELTKSEKSILIGLFLSKFDKEGLNYFGLSTFTEAFNLFSYILDTTPSTIKNYRDEFDPYFPNNRKGWRNREMKAYCRPIYDIFSSLSLSDFYNTIGSLLELDMYKEILNETTEENQPLSAQKRLVTGLAAEHYFKSNYRLIPEFQSHTLKDTTLFGCGYDFELAHSHENMYFVEVKGLSSQNGNIMLTQKEYYMAERLLDRYCLFVVKNFREKVNHSYYFNPLSSIGNFHRTERVVIQVNYSVKI